MYTIREANAVPITEYLSSLGIEPTKVRGNDTWYTSPFRDEHVPSFKVNTRLNLWFDHGSGEGGTLIDLGIRLEKVSYQVFIEKLKNGNFSRLALSAHQKLNRFPEANRLEITSVHPLCSPELLHYLKLRSITTETASQYCKEVRFKINDRNYLGVGFPNRSGGYELRNSWFKGSSSPKDISIITSNLSTIALFEGFMDFLSVFEINHHEISHLTKHSDFIVLNSLALLKRALPLLQNYKEINLFLDNDVAAKEAITKLKGTGVSFFDASHFYQHHKDVNEFHLKTRNSKHSDCKPRRLKGR